MFSMCETQPSFFWYTLAELKLVAQVAYNTQMERYEV